MRKEKSLDALMFDECVNRLKLIGASDRIVNRLIHTGEVSMSVNTSGHDHIITTLPNEDAMMRIIEVEEDLDCMVYHVVTEFCGNDIVEYMFMVLPDMDNWDSDRIDLGNLHSNVYAYNVDHPEESHSEFIEFDLDEEGRLFYVYDYNENEVLA